MYWEMAFSIIGGLGLFLFGMQMMASGMQMVAGDRLRRVLEVLTNHPVIGVLTGILVTLLIQSSSTTTVMVVGFANAGLMNLAQGISVIIGAISALPSRHRLCRLKLLSWHCPRSGLVLS